MTEREGQMSKVSDLFDDIEAMGGKVLEVGGPLPDGSGFAVASMPLPKDHWLTADGFDEPPAPMRIVRSR